MMQAIEWIDSGDGERSTGFVGDQALFHLMIGRRYSEITERRGAFQFCYFVQRRASVQELKPYLAANSVTGAIGIRSELLSTINLMRVTDR